MIKHIEGPRITDVPSLFEFDPHIIPYQYNVIKNVRDVYDYSLGVHEVLCSGSVGSAKSILGSHLAVTHCNLFPGAIVGIGRHAMPDLKRTLRAMIVDHLADDIPFKANDTTGEIYFPETDSVITCHSWADRRYNKFRSYKYSMFVIEELTEEDEPDAYEAILMRLNRLPHVKEKILLSLTNPDDPEHWAYEKLVKGAKTDPQKHVFYSKTIDNPFLDQSYIETLMRNLPAQMIKRMIEGLWVSVRGETIYYSYDPDVNYKDHTYEYDLRYPIRIAYDFNIGEGKPLSAAIGQYIPHKKNSKRKTWHWGDETVVHGQRTEDSLEEIAGQGFFDMTQERGGIKIRPKFIIHGDATGRRADTRSPRSDYDIIDRFLANYLRSDGKRLDYEIVVPRSNPGVRDRHNLMNGKMLNSLGEVDFYVYKGCRTGNKGLTLTKLKQGGKYVEDDSKPYQHITTGIGYALWTNKLLDDKQEQGTTEL